LDQIGNKKDFGAVFSAGTLRAAESISSEAVKAVVHCKGLDFPSHDARSCISLAPTYATGTRGACHFRGGCEDVEMGGFFIPEIGIREGTVKFFERENQSMVAARCQDYFALLNSLVICAFMTDGGGMSFTEIKEFFNAVTGWDYSIRELMDAGESIFTVQRLINIRDGYNAKSDVLPGKMFQPAKEGFRAGKVPPFRKLMKDYYALRGWNDNGEPTRDTLDRLGL